MTSYTLPGIPSDLMTSEKVGERELKVDDDSSRLAIEGFKGIFDNSIDVSGAVQGLDRFHYATHQGYAYSIDHEFILSGNVPQYLEIVVGQREIHMQDRSVNTDSSDVMVELYFEPVVTVGASPVAANISRFNFGKPSTHDVAAQTVESFAGGEFAGRSIIYGEDGVGNTSTGSGVSAEREKNFPAGSVVGVRVQRRTGTGAARVKIDFGFYEIWSTQ